MPRKDYNLKMAGIGEKTIENLPEVLPDVISLDIVLSGNNDYQICRKIRNNYLLLYIKIILVSGKIQLDQRLTGN